MGVKGNMSKYNDYRVLYSFKVRRTWEECDYLVGDVLDPRKVRRISRDGSPGTASNGAQLVWSGEVQKRLEEAVARLGIKNAVPETILQMMNLEGLTLEDVANQLKLLLYLKKRQRRLWGSNVDPSSSDSHYTSIFDSYDVYNLPPKFKEYMQKEKLEWWGHHVWVFWSQQVHEIEPSLSLDNCTGLNPNVCTIPKVRDNIIHALRKLISSSSIASCLAQFWAPTTSKGRTLLTTQNQPFSLGRTSGSVIGEHWLCEYRVKMCGEYFYGDVKAGEEELGLPGRVFLHKFLEFNPDVKCYTTKEYPQRNLAIRCQIKQSLGVPVFEHSSQTCVGVLEIVSQRNLPSDWHEGFLPCLNDILQEFGLQCFDGYQICEMQSREQMKRRDERRLAFKELNRVLRSVCEIHELPLAMTWVPCNACDGLLRGQFCSKYGFSKGVEFSASTNSFLKDFLQIGKCSHLRKGLAARMALSSFKMLYCSDIIQLSVDDYPLVPYARLCKLRDWFTICLRSRYTGDDIYVLEFFLSDRSKDDGDSKDDEDIQTRLSFILGTMEEKFKSFSFASGEELGNLMSFEGIYFRNDQRVHSVRLIQATRNFSSSSSDESSAQSSPASVTSTIHSVQLIQANIRPGFEDANMVIIKAKDARYTIKFQLSLPCSLVGLLQEVAKRLQLEAASYQICYEDESAGLIFIACDEDLQAWIDASI